MAKQRNALRHAAVAVLAVAVVMLGGCARISTDPSNWFSSDSSSSTPAVSGEEGGFTVSRGPVEAPTARAVTGSDLVGPDGRCEGVPAAPPEGSPVRGIGLTMTECELVSAAGTPEQVNLGANENGERRATLTYTKGDHPGIYTFVSGRLKVIERLPTPSKPEPRRRRPRKQRA
jgi:hypothetical protein